MDTAWIAKYGPHDVYKGIHRTTPAPPAAPTEAPAPAPEVPPPMHWEKVGSDYKWCAANNQTIAGEVLGSLDACKAKCESVAGCSYFGHRVSDNYCELWTASAECERNLVVMDAAWIAKYGPHDVYKGIHRTTPAPPAAPTEAPAPAPEVPPPMHWDK